MSRSIDVDRPDARFQQFLQDQCISAEDAKYSTLKACASDLVAPESNVRKSAGNYLSAAYFYLRDKDVHVERSSYEWLCSRVKKCTDDVDRKKVRIPLGFVT